MGRSVAVVSILICEGSHEYNVFIHSYCQYLVNSRDQKDIQLTRDPGSGDRKIIFTNNQNSAFLKMNCYKHSKINLADPNGGLNTTLNFLNEQCNQNFTLDAEIPKKQGNRGIKAIRAGYDIKHIADIKVENEWKILLEQADAVFIIFDRDIGTITESQLSEINVSIGKLQKAIRIFSQPCLEIIWKFWFKNEIVDSYGNYDSLKIALEQWIMGHPDLYKQVLSINGTGHSDLYLKHHERKIKQYLDYMFSNQNSSLNTPDEWIEKMKQCYNKLCPDNISKMKTSSQLRDEELLQVSNPKQYNFTEMFIMFEYINEALVKTGKV